MADPPWLPLGDRGVITSYMTSSLSGVVNLKGNIFERTMYPYERGWGAEFPNPLPAPGLG